ncbi:MAG: acyl-CoA thioesterase [Gammaproteobacteria bacterium]|nr:acyl-CoA thioesterase [Gammaproteobacteria bacterium]MCH9744663.1 acyl-CoA thioesterase [Gammaproteobacteria bacterium]
MNNEAKKQPQGDLAIRTLAMPANTNPDGDIFGGWVVSQMDLAGLSVARKYCHSRAVTVAIDSMVFLNPVHVGDFICCHARMLKTGRTSMTIAIEVWAIGDEDSPHRQVTEGIFTFVAVDEKGIPKPIEKHATE